MGQFTNSNSGSVITTPFFALDNYARLLLLPRLGTVLKRFFLLCA